MRWEAQLISFSRGLLTNAVYGTFSKFDSQGNLFVAAMATNRNGFSLIKATEAGEVWEKSFPASSCKGLSIQNPTGRILLVNVSSTNGWTDLEDVGVAELDTDGSQLWSTDYVTVGFPHDIASDSLGNTYVSGTTYEGFDSHGLLKPNGHLEIIKFNASGQRLWVVTNSDLSTGTSFAGASAADTDGNLYVAGTFDPPTGLGVAKFDSSGKRLWIASLGINATTSPDALSVAVDKQNNTVVGLSSRLGQTPFDFEAGYKLDQNGTILWRVQPAEVSDGLSPAGWALDQSNNFYVGFVRSGDHAPTIVKYDPDGNQLWEVANSPDATFPLWNLAGATISIAPNQDVLFQGRSTKGQLGIFRFQQNLLAGRPVIHDTSPSQTVARGTTVTLTGSVSGLEPLVYQWRRGGTNLTGATNSCLVLTNVTTSDSGSYSLLVTNSVGCAISSPGLLTVLNVQPFQFEYRSIGQINITLRLFGETNREYWIQVSSNLTDWSPLFGTFITSGSNGDYALPRDQRNRFFRVSTTP